MNTFIYFIVVGLSGYYLLMPFFRRNFGVEAAFSSNGHQDLSHEKQLLLNEVREIEFDYQMGKLSEEDYQTLSHEYKIRAAKVLKELSGKTPVKHNHSAVVKFCASCGAKQLAGARFCPSCGQQLEGENHEV
jgi:NADH pyrophosphatase NudC (nudix superfamily)